MPMRRDSMAPQTPGEADRGRIRALEQRVSLLAQRVTTTIQAIKKQDYADPVQGEVQWHYPWQRGYVWHNKEWRPLMPPTYHIKLFQDHKPVKVEVDRFVFAVSRDMHEFWLQDIELYVTAPGTSSVMVYNRTTSEDMLVADISTVGSNSGLTEAEVFDLIDPVNGQVSWKDEVAISVNTAGGEGLGIILVFGPENETHA